VAVTEAALEGTSLTPAERIMLQAKLGRLRTLAFNLKSYQNTPTSEIERTITSWRADRRAAAARERAAYQAMTADLQRLNQMMAQADVAVRLLDVVATSKVARLDEESAREVKARELTPAAAGDSVANFRKRATEALDRTVGILEELLKRELVGEDATRTKFFLGVIRYWQGVPRRAEGEGPDIKEPRLREAERIMRELASDSSTTPQWRSYATLYLGLILPIRANLETDPGARSQLLDEAEAFLNEAVRLDTDVPGPDQEPRSLSGGPIPEIAIRQREEVILPAREQKGIVGYQNDFALSTYVGAHRDTNVVLLGERTDLPRGITDESDFGFTLGLALDYTYSLGNLDPKLDRWTLGVRGLTTQLWHVDIDEFDEQTYAFSGALQYEAMRKTGNFGPIQLRLQYDYSWTNLGRDAFLGSNRLRPDVRIFCHDRRGETTVFFEYDIRDYHEPLFDVRFDRTGEYYRLGAGHSHKLIDMTPIYEEKGLPAWGLASDEGLRQDDPDYPKRYFAPFAGLSYGWDSTHGDEFDQKSYTFSTGFVVPLPWGLSFDASSEFEWEDYSHGSLTDFHRRGRRDLVQEYEIGLERTFVLQNGELLNRYTPTVDRALMSIRAHARWTLDDSNVQNRLGQAIFSYDRAFYGITIAFAFN